MPNLVLQKGKWYVTKRGHVGYCLGTAVDDPRDWLVRFGGVRIVAYHPNGNVRITREADYDIVAEHEEK
jgi:hypothetical protein